MANFKQENVKRFVEDISKDVAKNAYEGGGSYKGPVLMPLNAISAAALELDSTTEYMLDYAKLADKLEVLGIDVDSPLLREEETNIQIYIGGASITGSSNASAIVYMYAQKTGNLFNVAIMHNPMSPYSTDTFQHPIDNTSLRELLTEIGLQFYNVPGILVPDGVWRIISNEVVIARSEINDVEYKTIGNVQEFLKDLLVPQGSGSGSSE